MQGGTKLLSKRAKSKRTRTTTLTDFTSVRTVPRDLRARVLSPTRRHNPQPLGLHYQSPLSSNAKAYGIWNPDFRHTRARFPDLITHLDLTNFSCDVPFSTSPWDAKKAGPPEVLYSLKSTSRSSFQDPGAFPMRAGLGVGRKPTRYAYRPDDGPAVGIGREIFIVKTVKRINDKRKRKFLMGYQGYAKAVTSSTRNREVRRKTTNNLSCQIPPKERYGILVERNPAPNSPSIPEGTQR